jgi:TPR repeat protein
LLDEEDDAAAPDYPAAAGWYRRAADDGHAGAAFNLSRMFTLGLGWAWQMALASDFDS